MARTKETARKSTGLKAPRKHISGKVPNSHFDISGKRIPNLMGALKRVRRFRPGTVALREIRKFQRTVSYMHLDRID